MVFLGKTGGSGYTGQFSIVVLDAVIQQYVIQPLFTAAVASHYNTDQFQIVNGLTIVGQYQFVFVAPFHIYLYRIIEQPVEWGGNGSPSGIFVSLIPGVCLNPFVTL